MADPEHEKAPAETEKEYERERDETADPLAEAVRPEHDEDIDEEKEIAAAAAQSDDMDEIESIREQTEEINRMKRYASVTSANSVPDDAEPQTRKKWYRNLNPLRWGAVPPVPEVRKVCPEAQAGFLCKLIFQWQASLMQVSCLSLLLLLLLLSSILAALTHERNKNRRDTSASSRPKTYGWSTRRAPWIPCRPGCARRSRSAWLGETSTPCSGPCTRPTSGSSGWEASASCRRRAFRSSRPSRCGSCSSSPPTPTWPPRR